MFYKFYVDWYPSEDLEDNDILLQLFTSETVIDNDDILFWTKIGHRVLPWKLSEL